MLLFSACAAGPEPGPVADAVSLEPDYLQFMQLGPMPGTALHDAYLRAGKMLEGVPFSKQHGQDQIWFRHPEFTRAASRAFLKAAFQRDYQHGGATGTRVPAMTGFPKRTFSSTVILGAI